MKPSKAGLKIVVTGVGAIIGQGIVQSCRSAFPGATVIGVDRNNQFPGQMICDLFIPKTLEDESSPSYLDFWLELIAKYDADIILPGLEVDVHFFSLNRRIFERASVAVALNSSFLIELADNKLEFADYLASFGIPKIPSVRVVDWASAQAALGDPPYVLKPIRGNGSRGVHVIREEREFNFWIAGKTESLLLQKFVGHDDEEFTVGVFGLSDGSYLGPLIMRRRLSLLGHTVQVEVLKSHRDLEDATNEICIASMPIGPTNLQFRTENGLPMLLEVNPRFSSSNSLRSAFGFNESKMAVEYFLFEQRPSFGPITGGCAWRINQDVVVYDRNSL